MKIRFNNNNDYLFIESFDELFHLNNLNELIFIDCSNLILDFLPLEITTLINLKCLICNNTNLSFLPENFINLQNLEVLSLNFNIIINIIFIIP